MGYKTALELSEIDNQRTALVYHLTCNHYPPLPSSMVEACQRAIRNANAGDWDKNVRLPAGISYKGKTLAPTREIISAHHLDAFLDREDEYWLEDEE